MLWAIVVQSWKSAGGGDRCEKPGGIRGGGSKGNPGSPKEPESPAGGTGSCSQQVTSALEGETRARLPVASPRGFTDRGIVKWQRGIFDLSKGARGGEARRFPPSTSSFTPAHPLLKET